MMRIASRTLRRSRITRRGLFWVQCRKRDGMATPTVDSGIEQPTKWYSNSKKLVILSSQVPVLWVVGSWSRKEVEVPFTSMEILLIRNSCFKQFILWIRSVSMRPSRIGAIHSVWQMKNNKSLFLWTMEFWPWWDHKKWKCRYLFRTWHLETRCKEVRASEYWKRRYRWHNYVKKNFIPASCDSRKLLQHSTWWWRRMGEIYSSCREYSSSRACPKVQWLDQSSKFILWTFLTSKEKKLRFHHCRPKDTSYVVISRETERFVNEIHNHKAE